jgi:hypothetical protein
MARRLAVLLYGHDAWPKRGVDDVFFPDCRERELGAQLAIPIILTVAAFLALVARLRAAMWTLAVLLIALCILAA